MRFNVIYTVLCEREQKKKIVKNGCTGKHRTVGSED